MWCFHLKMLKMVFCAPIMRKCVNTENKGFVVGGFKSSSSLVRLSSFASNFGFVLNFGFGLPIGSDVASWRILAIAIGIDKTTTY